MKMEQIKEQFDRHVVGNYARFPICVVKGRGSRVWDVEGKSYLDLFPGWGVAGLGHCHPKVVEAIRRQAEKLIHVANHYYIEEQGAFAEALTTRSDGFKAFFCNSGAEANEVALKLIRLAGHPRTNVITMENSFHGRTCGALSATGQAEYRKPFEPLVPGFSYARFNDLDSVKALVDDKTAAIMLEPVQGEAGVVAATQEFLAGLRQLCDEKGIILVFDEVQTAPARLGTWFGYQYFGVKPDIITTAKAIAGGMPIAVMLARPEVAAFLKPGTHGSTFGGHSLGCAAGIAAIQAMEEEKVLDNVKILGAWLDGKLAEVTKIPGVKLPRRAGFMIGLELAYPGVEVVNDCRDHGLLINCTHGNILRMLPALNITREEMDEGLAILADSLARTGAKL